MMDTKGWQGGPVGPLPPKNLPPIRGYDTGRAEMEGQAVLLRALRWYANPMHRHGDYGKKAQRALARYERIMLKESR